MSALLGRLAELEPIARRLEPSPAERAALQASVGHYASAFLDSLPTRPVFEARPGNGAGILAAPIGDEPTDLATLLDLVGEHVDRPGINPASQGHLGYIPGGGVPHAAYGDFLAAITNRYAGVFFASPGAVRMENMLLAWMASLVGYPGDAVGNLTSGGSIANLIGLVTARDAAGIRSADVARGVIYLTTHVHHSVDKAIRIAGLGDSQIRHVPMDARHRMQADALADLVRADIGAGLRPWLVIGSAGTTDAGAVDPMHAIGDIADRYDLWFHLDAAYGGFFVLCEEGRRRLDGMARSHSIVMDPHKGLFLPYGSGAVIVKDRRAMYDAHYYAANYMQDTLEANDEPSPADLSPELTKHFRGLRMWLPLKLCGLAPFRAALEEKLLLARYAYERLLAEPRCELGPEPDLSVVTFRFLPDRGDADAFNRRVVQAVHDDGRVFISSSMIDGTFTLRFAILSFRTHRDTIDLAIDVLRQAVSRSLRNADPS